jgi:hypothetical protein
LAETAVTFVEVMLLTIARVGVVKFEGSVAEDSIPDLLTNWPIDVVSFTERDGEAIDGGGDDSGDRDGTNDVFWYIVAGVKFDALASTGAIVAAEGTSRAPV